METLYCLLTLSLLANMWLLADRQETKANRLSERFWMNQYCELQKDYKKLLDIINSL